VQCITNGFQRNSPLAHLNNGCKLNSWVVVLNTNSIRYENNKPLLTERCLPVAWSENPNVSYYLNGNGDFPMTSGKFRKNNVSWVILIISILLDFRDHLFISVNRQYYYSEVCSRMENVLTDHKSIVWKKNMNAIKWMDKKYESSQHNSRVFTKLIIR